MRDPLEDRPTADPTDDDGGTPHDPERAEQEAIARSRRLDEGRWYHEPEEPPSPELVRESGTSWLFGGLLALVTGLPLAFLHSFGLALVVAGVIGLIEGPRRMVTGRRTVDLPPALGCVTLLGMFAAAAVVLWLMLSVLR